MENTVNLVEDIRIADLVVPRFLNYVRCWTTSDRHIEETPSTPGQWELARRLAEELRGLGITEVELTDHGYVLARVPASPGKETQPAVAFMAHLDTAEDVPGKDVKPQVVKHYDGRRIELAGGLALDPLEDPDLAAHQGRDIIHTDGTTLLGADDKAGIAEIMGALEYILAHPEMKHGPVELIFSPDEETGKGLPEFPLEWVKSSACYTLDGGRLGELEVECFNAYGAEVHCTGRAIHPGYGRGLMANATLMAAAFATMLPRSESPEATDGYYGYYNPMEIKGDAETAVLTVYIRDFERLGAERRLAALEYFARAVEAQFPGGKIRVTIKPQYYNMKEKILERPEVLEILKKAASNRGIKFYMKPIRGGTDGSRLTELGIPTPNIFTGGRNWHSRIEWASVSEMIAACELVIELIRLWGEQTGEHYKNA
ncbi:MAG: peptidase T [Spirochaetaceae bacterium]|jgi:tripeptide aminopeptidase|nr:peptidase T [Spirochaetaceae bacterium]